MDIMRKRKKILREQGSEDMHPSPTIQLARAVIGETERAGIGKTM